MNVMKTSLTIFSCVHGSAFPIIRVCPGLSFATKSFGPPFCTLFTFVTCCSLQITLSQNYSATYNFSTCRHYLTENHLSFPSAPRWVRHSYLSERATIDPLYLWVINHLRCHFYNCYKTATVTFATIIVTSILLCCRY